MTKGIVAAIFLGQLATPPAPQEWYAPLLNAGAMSMTYDDMLASAGLKRQAKSIT